MKKTLMVIVASTALTAAIGVPTWSAMQATAEGSLRPFAAFFEEGRQATPLVLARDDDDRHWREGKRRGHDDDDDDRHWREGKRRGHDNDDDDCDDNDCRGGAHNPVPAGTVAPPQNGLFGNGTPPQVQMN